MVNTKQFYVQIFGEQKHLTPDPASLKISTKEYFERDKDVSIANVSSKVTILETKYHIIKYHTAIIMFFLKAVDPEAQKLKDEINIYKEKEKRNVQTIVRIFNFFLNLL